MQSKQSVADSTLREKDKADTPISPNGNVPTTSARKDTQISNNEQGSSVKNQETHQGGTEAESRADALQAGSNDGVQEVHVGLNDNEAEEFLSRMEANAVPMPQLKLTQQAWGEQFGDDGKVTTPVGSVKVGANQMTKLFFEGRSEKFGMLRPTFTEPLAIIEVTSEATDGNTERATSLLFVKTFVGKNGEKVYYFKSVTVKKDGMRVSVSSYYDRPKRIKEALKTGKLLYRFDGGAQTEQRPADVSVTASQEDVQGISTDKDKQSSATKQANEDKSTQYSLLSDKSATDDKELVSNAIGKSFVRQSDNNTLVFKSVDNGLVNIELNGNPISVRTEEAAEGLRNGRWEEQQGQQQEISAEKPVETEPKPIGKGVFGNIYDQFKGKAKEAVAFLRNLKSGEAIGALHHKDVGEIAIVWGNAKAGLQKIAKKHPEVLDNLQEVIDGMNVVQESDNRIKLESDTHFAVVSRDWQGEKRSPWLLTVYEKKESSATNNRMDTADTSKGKRNDTATPQDTASASKDTQSSNNEQGSSVKNQETDAIPTDEEVGITQSNSVLQGEEVDNRRGDNESQEQGGTIEVGTQGEVENGFVHQGAQGGVDKQGNPINADGTLKVDKVNSINELTDADFENPTRNVELPAIPENVDKAIGANGKPVVIKKNIFEKNKKSHNFSNQQSRDILTNALYNTDLVGQTQPTKRPKHWVAIQLDEKSPITVLEVNENKDNVEVVGWYTLDNRNLERIKRQAANEGGELLMLSSKDKVESLSTPNSILSSADKDKQSSDTKQVKSEKTAKSNAVSEDLFATAERVAVEDEAKRTRKKEEAKVDKRLVSDERMEELKKRLREKLRGQLNMGIDPELLAIGTEIAVGHIERGVSKFSEYAKTMIEDLGDTIRPYLKAFYNGARDMPELGELADQLTPYEEVRTFNVATIGEEGEEVKPTILQQAEQISNEHQVEQKTKEEAKQTSETTDVDNELYSITKQHNNKKDVDIWVVRGKERVDRDVFLQQKQTAKQTNGYYSSFRGVNGFVFNTSEEAQMFADNAFIKQQQDQQGNPINEDGTLKVEKVNTIDEITDIDFDNPTRNVELPTLPQNVDEAIGANGKPIVIKKNIFEKNKQSHSDLTPVQSRDILQSALYNADLYGQNQKAKRPYNWIVINTKDKTGNNRLVLLEVNDKKDNVEIVHWHYIREAALETIKRQAEREGGLILILPSDYSEEAGGLSSRTQDLSSVGKDTQSSNNEQGSSVKNQETDAIPTDDEVVSITDAMKANAVIAPTVEINDANWKESVDTPIGTVKMGENQKAKLFAKGREQQYGMLLETLSNPDVVLEEKDKGQNMFHERPSSYLFVKTFQKEDGSKYVHFESVTVSQDGMEVSISSHIIRENQLKNKLKSDRLLYKATALDAPANTSAEQPIVGGSLSSAGKDKQSSATKQANEDKSTPTAKKTEERVSEYNEHVSFKYVGEREDRGNTYLYEDVLYNGKEIGRHVQQQRNDDRNPLAVLQDFHEVYLLDVPVSDYDPRDGNEKWTIGGKEIEDTSLGANHIQFENEEELIDFYEKNKDEIEERRKRADYYNNRRKVTAKVEETTERDKQYLEAVQRGDMNTAKEATEQKDSSANDTARSHTFDKEVNEQFNRELAELTEENVQSKRLKLGYPSPMLSAAGVPDKPIILYGNKLLKKAKLHNFDVKDLHNLPLAMQNPIAVFEGSHPNSFATLLEIKLGGYNTLASIEVNKKGEADFNFISSLFGKESKGVTKWILDGKLLSVDKEKAQSYISASALNADATYKKELSSAAKIVKDFVNPNIGEEKLREGYGSYTNEELSFINDSWAKMIGKSNRAAFAERERSRMTNRVEELADTLHLDNVEVVTDASQLEGKRAKAKGFYSKRTGKITIVLPNHANIADVEKTLLHEAVAHHGLRELFGEEFDNMIESIFMQVDAATRLEIMRKSSKRGWDYVTATEEYLASMAEDTNFEHVKPSVWQRIKQFFGEMLSAVGLHRAELTDNDLRYILWRSYENLKKGGKRGVFDVAEDVAMQYRLKVGNYAAQEADGSDESDQVNKEKALSFLSHQSAPIAATAANAGQESSSYLHFSERNISEASNNQELNSAAKIVENFENRKLNDDVIYPIVENGSLQWVDKEKALNYLHHSALRAEALSSSRLNSAAKIIKDFENRKLNDDVIYPIVENGSLQWVDKEKGLNWLSSVSHYAQQEIDNQALNSATKIVENFENRKLNDDVIYRDNDSAENTDARSIYEQRVRRSMFQTQEALQDSMLGLKEAMEAITKSEGKKIERVLSLETKGLFLFYHFYFTCISNV